jgi:hypothetical protein
MLIIHNEVIFLLSIICLSKQAVNSIHDQLTKTTAILLKHAKNV